ncbi:MAG: glycosyltransferase [Methanosphaera stadtmanae]|nr:glycosyltransferase [Methanosphaera stadtmanae]
MVKVSVIIPVYNVEKYLKLCMDSIVNQTLSDIEIICVNDGSTDNSLNILKEYAQSDNRIMIISQENMGHAVATNKGIDLAQGKYLFFMDSDDILDVSALEKTFKAAEEKNVDFVFFKAINYDEETEEYYETENYSMQAVVNRVGDEVFNYNDLKELSFNMAVTPWTKLYKKDFIKNHGIRFPEGLIFEDNIVFWESLFLAEKIYFLDEFLFTRRWRNTSSTRAGDKRFIDSIIINTMILDLFKEYGKLDDKSRSILCNRKISLSYIRFNKLKEEFKSIYFDELQKNFFNWLKEENLYDYLQTILHPKNKYILDSVLKSREYMEFELLMENYDLKNKNNFQKNKSRILIDELHTDNEDLIRVLKKNNLFEKELVKLQEKNLSVCEKQELTNEN